jgi:hypothetical protein
MCVVRAVAALVAFIVVNVGGLDRVVRICIDSGVSTSDPFGDTAALPP